MIRYNVVLMPSTHPSVIRVRVDNLLAADAEGAERTALGLFYRPEGFATESVAPAVAVQAAPADDAQRQQIIAEFLERTGQYVTNDASREAARKDAYAEGWQDGSSETVRLLSEPAKKLIGWRTPDYLSETADRAKAKSWEASVGALPIFEGDPNTKLSAQPSPAVDEARPSAPAEVMDRRKLAEIAMQAAWRASGDKDAPKYLPRSTIEAAVWKPHSWVLQAMADAIKQALAAHPKPAVQSERERMRADQAEAVMPQIGPLLDAWDGIPNDTKGSIAIEAPGLVRLLKSINRAMEGDEPASPMEVSERQVFDILRKHLGFGPDTYRVTQAARAILALRSGASAQTAEGGAE